MNRPCGNYPVYRPRSLPVFSGRFGYSSPRCPWRPARHCRRSRGTGRARNRKRTCRQCLIGSSEIYFSGTTGRARGRVDGHLGTAFRAFPELPLETRWPKAHFQLTPFSSLSQRVAVRSPYGAFAQPDGNSQQRGVCSGDMGVSITWISTTRCTRFNSKSSEVRGCNR